MQRLLHETLCFHMFKKKNLILPVVGIIIIGVTVVGLTTTITVITTDGT